MIIATDFDGTLTTGEMGRAIGKYLKQNGHAEIYKGFFRQQLPRYILAKLKLMDMRDFKKGWALAMPYLFTNFTTTELETMFETVVAEELWAKRRQDVIDELAQQAGHRVLIVSGSYQPLLAAFAHRIGAEAHGTDLELQNGRSTGKIVEPLNVGANKVQRLKTLLNGQPLDMAYGDSLDDLPMLEMSRTPVAVYPDAKLLKVAKAKGWRIIS